jgi:DNA-binding XRE family transcriptional regulator
MTKNRTRAAVGVTERTEKKTEDTRAQSTRNNVRKIRESLLMSKAELARKAGLSALTIDRVESGYNCRMDTKRKIILALGLRLSDKDKVFASDESGDPQ